MCCSPTNLTKEKGRESCCHTTLGIRCVGLKDVGYIQKLGFFCWQLFGYVPGGAPFSQLNIGVTDAMAIIKVDEVHQAKQQKHAKPGRETIHRNLPNSNKEEGVSENPKVSTTSRSGTDATMVIEIKKKRALVKTRR